MSGPPLREPWRFAPNAKLLKRVFEIDMAHCAKCGGELKIIGSKKPPGCGF